MKCQNFWGVVPRGFKKVWGPDPLDPPSATTLPTVAGGRTHIVKFCLLLVVVYRRYITQCRPKSVGFTTVFGRSFPAEPYFSGTATGWSAGATRYEWALSRRGVVWMDRLRSKQSMIQGLVLRLSEERHRSRPQAGLEIGAHSAGPRGARSAVITWGWEVRKARSSHSYLLSACGAGCMVRVTGLAV